MLLLLLLWGKETKMMRNGEKRIKILKTHISNTFFSFVAVAFNNFFFILIVISVYRSDSYFLVVWKIVYWMCIFYVPNCVPFLSRSVSVLGMMKADYWRVVRYFLWIRRILLIVDSIQNMLMAYLYSLSL